MPAGRPTEYRDDTAAAICGRMAGGESLVAICRSDDMPARSTVFKWLGEQPKFSDMYAHARDAQADAIFDEALDIADDARNDWMDRTRGDGTVDRVLDVEHVQRSKLRIETRKWMAGRLAPKKYGDRLNVDSKVEATVREDLDLSGLTKKQRDDLTKLLTLARGTKP